MKNVNVLILVILIGFRFNAQNPKSNKVWIREDFIISLEKENDTLPAENYLGPISGFINLFQKHFAIAGFRSDILEIGAKNYKIIDQFTIRIDQSYAGLFLKESFLKSNNIKVDKDLFGLLTLKEGKLLYQIIYKHKLVTEYYFVNHYKDYYFEDYIKSKKYLYSIKQKK